MSQDLEFLLEAHNDLSVKIGEEAGFKGLWASGLCLSAQYGVRDSNEASWSQVLEFMADVTSVPILLDGDTGYGNFNNVRRLVRKLEQRGISAVCLEDKLYPKTNSFIDGNKQQLADVEEFCGRIRSGKDAQSDDGFCIITRVEALIAGWGMGEALTRAAAYHEAGADSILVHSALSSPREVLQFKAEWSTSLPGCHRPDEILRHGHRRVPRCGYVDRHLGESSSALRRCRHAELRRHARPGAEPARSRGSGRLGGRDLPSPGSLRAQGRRGAVFAAAG
jgi:2-methylisocitrate lyase-like PEP mutase family enzyme